eukprot:16084-Pleurochrysis_carterae.AAC.4
MAPRRAAPPLRHPAARNGLGRDSDPVAAAGRCAAKCRCARERGNKAADSLFTHRAYSFSD